VSGDGEALVCQVELVELEVPDRDGLGCVHGGQREDQSARRCGGVVDDALQDWRMVAGGPDVRGGIGEDPIGSFAEAEDRAQRDQDTFAAPTSRPVCWSATVWMSLRVTSRKCR
jgi:hypothetical protein